MNPHMPWGVWEHIADWLDADQVWLPVPVRGTGSFSVGF